MTKQRKTQQPARNATAISNLMKSDTPGLLEPRLQGQILLTLRRPPSASGGSYTVSTSCNREAQTRPVRQILRRVGITVVTHTTATTPPLPVREREVIILPATAGAQLRRCEPPVCILRLRAVPDALVLQLGEKARHASIRLPSQVLQLHPNNGRSKQKANVDRHGTPVGRPYRQQQRLPKHLRRDNPAAGHSDRHQRHGRQMISTGDTVEIKGQIGRAVIKARGTRVALHRTKPQVSARTADCRLIARRSGYSIRHIPPTQ